MTDHRHQWERVSSSQDGSSIEYACTLEGCEATKTDFKGAGPAVAEDQPAEPRRVFGSASSVEFIEPE